MMPCVIQAVQQRVAACKEWFGHRPGPSKLAVAAGGIAIKVVDGEIRSDQTAAAWCVPQTEVAALLRSFLP